MCCAGHPTDPETNRQGETEGNLNINGSEFLCVLIFSLLCLAAPVNPHLRKYSFISLSLTCVKSWPCTRCPSRFRADDKCSTCGRSRRVAGSPCFHVGWRRHSHTQDQSRNGLGWERPQRPSSPTLGPSLVQFLLFCGAAEARDGGRRDYASGSSFFPSAQSKGKHWFSEIMSICGCYLLFIIYYLFIIYLFNIYYYIIILIYYYIIITYY